jgi:hypothetical protein
MIAEAERKAIAMHSPLPMHSPGDPQLIIPVVANPVRTTWVGQPTVSATLSWNGSYTAVIRPATPDRLIYDLQDRRQMLWEEAKSLYATVSDLQRTFTRREQALWDRLEAEINAIDGRLAACHRNTTCGPGKPSPLSRRQTGHTPEPG